MIIPSHEDAMLPVLQELADGEVHHRRVLADAMSNHFGLSADDTAWGRSCSSWKVDSWVVSFEERLQPYAAIVTA
jgi:restriction endonuclease Mrr